MEGARGGQNWGHFLQSIYHTFWVGTCSIQLDAAKLSPKWLVLRSASYRQWQKDCFPHPPQHRVWLLGLDLSFSTQCKLLRRRWSNEMHPLRVTILLIFLRVINPFFFKSNTDITHQNAKFTWSLKKKKKVKFQRNILLSKPVTLDFTPYSQNFCICSLVAQLILRAHLLCTRHGFGARDARGDLRVKVPSLLELNIYGEKRDKNFNIVISKNDRSHE